MTIREMVEMVYNQHEVINITIQLINGMRGKIRTMNKTEALDFINGYENEKVVSFYYDAYQNNPLNGKQYKREIPYVSIEYIES